LLWTGCAIYWMGRDFYIGFYSQGAFCLFSVGLNLYGFYNWKKKKIGS